MEQSWSSRQRKSCRRLLRNGYFNAEAMLIVDKE
jgi:hypothetical protein